MKAESMTMPMEVNCGIGHSQAAGIQHSLHQVHGLITNNKTTNIQYQDRIFLCKPRLESHAKELAKPKYPNHNESYQTVGSVAREFY